MDLRISVFLLFVLFTAGHALDCYECLGLTGSCADQKLKTCPSGSNQCMSSTVITQCGPVSVKVYHHLSYGVASAPSIFQAVMDQILQGLEHVTCFLDDILITASTKEEHVRRLDEVLSRLDRNGLRVKLSKYQFMQSMQCGVSRSPD